MARTVDGKVAGPGGQRLGISNDSANRAVHQLRSRSDAILVGITTVMADDPLLTVRGVKTSRPLLRIIVDSDLRLPIHSQLVRTTDRRRVIVFCGKEAADYSGTRVVLAACGVEIHAVSSVSPGRLNLREVIERIGRLGVTHLLVEPGPTLAASFLAEGLWDRAWVIQSTTKAAGPGGIIAPSISGVPTAQAMLDDDRLTEYLNPAGIYHGPFPSADFNLTLPQPGIG